MVTHHFLLSVPLEATSSKGEKPVFSCTAVLGVWSQGRTLAAWGAYDPIASIP